MRVLSALDIRPPVAGAATGQDMSQVELARRIGRHQTAIGPYERDEYEPPRDVVEKLALVLETSPEYLYFGRSPHAERRCRWSAGSARAGMLEPQPRRPWSCCSLRDQQLRGYRVLDDSMAPVFRPGADRAGARRRRRRRRRRCSGRDALVELVDGRVLLRRLLPSARPARFDLAAYNAPLLPMVGVREARSIVGVLWPEAWRDGR